MRADLHIHSNNSDGTDSVEKIVDKAVAKGLEVIAITDHDNVGGVERAIEYANGKILVISGIELSTYSEENDNLEIHVLGYGIDYKNEELLGKIDEFMRQREIRIRKILALLKEHKIYVSEYDINMDCPGRFAIAKVMLKRKYVSSIQEAFDKYLGDKGSCYVPSMRVSTVEGVKLLKRVGGTPVLAHPEKYLKRGILEDMLVRLKTCGLGGMECFYPSHDEETTAKLVALADKYGLIKTVGCDYHGKGRSAEIGQLNVELDKNTTDILMGK